MEPDPKRETQTGRQNAVHLYWNRADETWNAYGKSVENALRISLSLRILTDEAAPGIRHLKVDTEQYEQYGLADCCVAVDDEHLELAVPENEPRTKP